MDPKYIVSLDYKLWKQKLVRMSFQINFRETENQTILVCEIQCCFTYLKVQAINYVENIFIIRISITHKDSKEGNFNKKIHQVKNIKTHSCLCLHLFLFKWFENKESAKIQWVENYKQDFNYVF